MLFVLVAIVIGAIMARSPITGGLARADKASVDKHAAKRGLPLPNDLRPVITDRLVRREKRCRDGLRQASFLVPSQ